MSESDEIRAIAQWLWDENETAAVLLEDILTGPRAWWPQRLRRTHGAMSLGMVQQLLRRMMTVATQRPEDALQITSMAMMVAEELEADDYPPAMVLRARGQALRDHGSVLAFMHRFAEALEYVERAERAFEGVPCAAYERARLALVKANALRMLKGRHSEAAALARDAAGTLLLLGDRARYVIAKTMEAAAVYHGGAIEAALEVWTSIENDPGLDRYLRASVTYNVAMCLVELGRGAETAASFEFCMGEFAGLGMPTEVTRARWYFGKALLATERQGEAILALRTAWQEFTEVRLMVDAALAALDLADGLLSNEEPEEVPAICREAIAQLTAAGLPEQAAPALRVLGEAVAMGNASRAMIRDAHAVVKGVWESGRRYA